MSVENDPRPVVLSIAGSDSGGGAGVQADIRAITRLGCFATTAITALTAQNLEGVYHVQGSSLESVQAQIQAVVTGFEVAAVKTGMLWSADIVSAVGALAASGQLPRLVVDPVMVATSGARLLAPEAVAAYEADLLPHAALVTPNLDEASLLLGQPITRDGLEPAARALSARYATAVLLKGGHLEGKPVDVLATNGRFRVFENERVTGVNTHGSGCTLSAAIAAELALGLDLEEACGRAIAFLHGSLGQPVRLAGGIRLLGIDNVNR